MFGGRDVVAFDVVQIGTVEHPVLAVTARGESAARSGLEERAGPALAP